MRDASVRSHHDGSNSSESRQQLDATGSGGGSGDCSVGDVVAVRDTRTAMGVELKMKVWAATSLGGDGSVSDGSGVR